MSRRYRFLRNGQPRDGRLWDRSSPEDLALAFSRHALEFLIWITAQKPGDNEPPISVPAQRPTARRPAVGPLVTGRPGPRLLPARARVSDLDHCPEAGRQ